MPNIEKYEKSSLVLPRSGTIAARINRLTEEYIQEISRQDPIKLSEIIEFLERDPVARACAELKALRATISIGQYEHKNEDYQAWVRSNFETMDGSLAHIVGQLCTAMSMGFAVAEIILSDKMPGYKNQWRLKGINILDPQYVTFAGCRGDITHVVYDDGDTKKWIPYNKCIHISNGFATNFNEPYGSSEAKRALPYYKAKQIILAEMTIAAKNNATGVWFGQAESTDTVELIGPDKLPLRDYMGKPIRISAVESLAYQLQNLEGGNVLVTDKKNSVMPLQMNAGEGFWNFALNQLNDAIYQAFSVPKLIFNEGSGALGGVGLSQAHRTVLDSQIESVVLAIREQLLENIVRPLLVYNFGESREWGDFASQSTTDETAKGMRVSNILMAISSGVLSPQDIDVVNKLRDDLDLPQTTEERLAELQQQQLLQQIQQAQAMNPLPPEETQPTEQPALTQ